MVIHQRMRQVGQIAPPGALARIDTEVQRGRDSLPLEVHLQTLTLRYARQFWVEATGLEQHWQDSRIDARRTPEGQVALTTSNITHVRRWLAPALLQSIEIDGKSLDVSDAERNDDYLALERHVQWQVVAPDDTTEGQQIPILRKRPRQQGPIDDAFLESRYVVINSGPTFREEHDRTNSLQNPKLPDWAILQVDQPPDGTAAGRVIAADFFSERWEVNSP